MVILEKARTLILVFLILFFAPQYSLSEEQTTPENIQKEVANNVCDEYALCAAYYAIIMHGVKDRGEEVHPLEQAFNQALYAALVVAKTGRSQEMAEKVVNAKIELFTKDMLIEMEKDYSNASILINKYAHHCKDIMENPDRLFEEWSNKILERHGMK